MTTLTEKMCQLPTFFLIKFLCRYCLSDGPYYYKPRGDFKIEFISSTFHYWMINKMINDKWRDHLNVSEISTKILQNSIKYVHI